MHRFFANNLQLALRLAGVCLFLLPATGQAQQAPVPAGMIADPQSGCATTNPIPRVGESIRWTGGCSNGLLSGPGTLLWLRDGRARERNEGTFVDGEMDGQASTQFSDGTLVIGQYRRGVRNGEFVIRRPNGNNIRAVYADGQLISERRLSDSEIRDFRERPADQPVAALPAPAATPQPQYAQQPVQYYQPAPAYQAPAYQVPAYQQQPAGAQPYVSPWSPSAYRPNGGMISATAPPQTYQQPIYQQPAYQAPAYQPPVYQQPAYQPYAMPQIVPAPAPQAMPAPTMLAATDRVNALGGPDVALNDAMMLERAGRNAEAAQLYADIAALTGNTPTGLLANERAQRLRAPMPQVVAYPGAAAPLMGTTPLDYAQRRQPLAGRFVCSAPGIFPNRANWCGRALREEGNDVEVEVRSVRLNRFFAIGFSAAPCTGNTFLSIFGSGKRIWVSRGCLGGNL